ncbi:MULTISPECIES: MFS transporter [Leuconostoc]|uniref:MFS transporter n=1 Tax=Leuconostoc pseudomesenteroides TaxID=33968 RepID=A0A5B8T0L5_LEUPS|nr:MULTISPECIES: MFS transporter [Leuconostoc]MCC8438855.1 MFS transporter [Leuconostoc pseudomesenteroides]MDG9732708.1 MFS transporter [Leuconostoc pseudomesenteroides]MDN2450382.1 MFS transporter [Leuconostoc sp. UCMA20149]NKZ35509.1 MFS transporter [Leuconostoc pseudomesenteroides]QEA41904.1 MFS transporter [Leuconostoc pseudomesenteroides]
MKKKLFVATLVSYLGIYITMPVLSAISTKAHLMPGQIGIMISLGAFAMLLFAPIWGKLSDSFGRRIVMIIGLLGMGAFFILYVALLHMAIGTATASSMLIYALMGTRFLLGIFMTTTPTAANAYMADISSVTDRAKDMSSLGFATGLAMVLGPIIGGLISASGNLYLPFYTTIVLLLIFAVIMTGILPKQQITIDNAKNDETTQKQKSKFFSVQLLSWLLVGSSVMFVVVGLQLLTSLYLHDNIGQSVIQSAKTSSFLFVILGVTLMIVQILQIKVFNFSARQMMLIGIPLIVIGLLLIASANAYWLMIVSYIFIGAGAALGMSSLSAGASLTVSQEHQGAVAGAVAMTQAIAGIVSPLFGSFIYQINTKLPFLFFAGFAVLTYVLFMIITAHQAERGVRSE